MPKALAIMVLLASAVCPAALADPNHAETLELARRADADAYGYATRERAQIGSSDDGRTFLVWWQPAGFNFREDPVFVSLHGSAGWATRDFMVWHERLRERGYAYLGVQWWYGRSDEPHGYAHPRDVYRWIEAELERRAIPRGHAVFQGFSRGSAVSYAVTHLDRKRKNPYFALTVSNAGAMEPGYPPNKAFLEKHEGAPPLSGAHWALYCAERDAERPGSCDAMERTRELLEQAGAKVDLFIRDAAGGHGGFMDAATQAPAFELADRILGEARA